MRLETAEAIIKAADELDIGMRLVKDYSGRGMFGATTAAVTYGTHAELEAALVTLGDRHPDPLALGNEVFHFRHDQLGRGLIVY